MSTLTSKFQAYRKSGAKRKAEPVKVAYVKYKDRPIYLPSGWRSNEETREQRKERLLQAKLGGFQLTHGDERWLLSRGGDFKTLLSNNAERRIARESHFKSEYLYNHSAAPYRG